MKIDLTKLYEDNLKEFNEIEKIIKEEGVSLFGAGVQGRYALEYLKKYNYKINYFIDNDKNKCGKNINGIEIIQNGSDLAKKQKVVFITIFYSKEIIEQNRYEYIIPFNKFFFIKEFNNFIKIIDLFYDDESKNVYDTLLFSKFISNTMYIIPNIYSRNHYFAVKECLPNNLNEIFLDAGAYVGDTVEKFIVNCEGTFDKIYAFEPSDIQYNSMNIRVKRLIDEWALYKNSIILEKLGLSNENKILFLDKRYKASTNSITDDGNNEEVKVVSIDNYLNGNPITFLKADIEGGELNMLKGASETIKKYKPKMAISIYHKPDDFFTIPEFIKSLVPEYKFYLRHHSINFAETVLYCCV